MNWNCSTAPPGSYNDGLKAYTQQNQEAPPLCNQRKKSMGFIFSKEKQSLRRRKALNQKSQYPSENKSAKNLEGKGKQNGLNCTLPPKTPTKQAVCHMRSPEPVFIPNKNDPSLSFYDPKRFKSPLIQRQPVVQNKSNNSMGGFAPFQARPIQVPFNCKPISLAHTFSNLPIQTKSQAKLQPEMGMRRQDIVSPQVINRNHKVVFTTNPKVHFASVIMKNPSLLKENQHDNMKKESENWHSWAKEKRQAHNKENVCMTPNPPRLSFMMAKDKKEEEVPCSTAYNSQQKRKRIEDFLSREETSSIRDSDEPSWNGQGSRIMATHTDIVREFGHLRLND